MTQAFYKRRRIWTQQPQQAAQIDWSNPITRGLAFAAIPGIGDVVSGAQPSLVASSRLISNRYGRAYAGPLTQTTGGWIFNVTIPSSMDITVIDLYRTPVANSAYASITFNSAEPVVIRGGGSSANFITASNSTTAFSTTTGNYNSFACRKIAGSNTGFLNGILKSTDVTGNRVVSAISQVSIGNGASTNTEDIQHNIVLYFLRGLSVGEIQSLSENPWKIFRAPDSRIWLPAAGGSILNVASLYTPADASSYQARVDLQQSISALQTVASASGFVVNVDLQRTLASIFTPASALGYVAGVNLTRNISAVLAQATAAGNTATVTLAGVLTIPATLATATASGANANVNLAYQFTASPATSAASGYQASVNLSGVRNITGSLSVATASGQTARIDRQYSIAADFAQAVASAAPAVVSFGGSGSFTPEQLAEILAYVEANMSVPTTADIAAAVLAALNATTIPVNTTQVNGHTIYGTGLPPTITGGVITDAGDVFRTTP